MVHLRSERKHRERDGRGEVYLLVGSMNLSRWPWWRETAMAVG
jgi:hypothetical protein